MAASNPTTEGDEKSLRQVPPGGLVFPAIFAGIALLFALGMVRGGATSPVGLLVGMALVLAFLVPAYILWASGRDSGIFVNSATVEFRILGRPRHSWPRSDVKELKPSLRGVAVVGPDGRTLREFRYRYWRADQVEALARSADLAPSAVTTATAAADAAPEAPKARARAPRKPATPGKPASPRKAATSAPAGKPAAGARPRTPRAK